MQDNNQLKQVLNKEYLNEKGLNIQAVININNIPAKLLSTINNSVTNTDQFKQLIILGHLGKLLWEKVNASTSGSDNPIDDYASLIVNNLFSQYYPDNHFEIAYPGSEVIGLQQLGQLAGWHNASPFKVGINDQWGSWFAYRAVVLADTNFISTDVLESISPCISCKEQLCISACPSNALVTGELDNQCCIDYRKQAVSDCKNTCLARVSCPVGSEYRYTDEQIHYHYGLSMRTIEEFY